VTRALALGVLLVGGAMALLLAGLVGPPLTRTCAPGLDEDVCAATIRAALGRGLPTIHPLILVAHVEPGTNPGPQELGHRATVTFDLLGVPGPTEVRLYTDQGGHWGGVPDRPDGGLAAWAAAPLVVATLVAAGLLGYGRSRTLTASRASKTR
jgi:hypothetical protein